MAGAGFKTFNTGDVLTSSDVNTYLMQQTVMVFDDASARSTALPTPSEGMFSYLKDTNLTYRYDGSAWLSDAGTTSPLTTKGDVWGYSTTDARIPVGANGTVLTADSAQTLGVKWAAPSSGLTLISSTSLSASSSTSIDNVFSSTYLNYFIVTYIESSSTNNYALLRMRVSGTDATGGNYNWYGARNAGSSWANSLGSGATSFEIGDTTGATSASSFVQIFAPNLADATQYTSLVSCNNHMSVYGGSHTLNTAYTGFTILTNTGTITGTVKVYGLAN